MIGILHFISVLKFKNLLLVDCRIVDSHTVVRNNIQRSHVPFTQFPQWYCLAKQ